MLHKILEILQPPSRTDLCTLQSLIQLREAVPQVLDDIVRLFKRNEMSPMIMFCGGGERSGSRLPPASVFEELTSEPLTITRCSDSSLAGRRDIPSVAREAKRGLYVILGLVVELDIVFVSDVVVVAQHACHNRRRGEVVQTDCRQDVVNEVGIIQRVVLWINKLVILFAHKHHDADWAVREGHSYCLRAGTWSCQRLSAKKHLLDRSDA